MSTPTWEERIYEAHPRSEAEHWPDALKVRCMSLEIADLRAIAAALVDPDFLANLARSRAKYPGNRRMFDGLAGELHELARAYGGDGDIRAEALDVAVVAYRIATEGDSGGNVTLDAVPADFAWKAQS